MPDVRDLPLFRWGEELRRVRAERRHQRGRSAAAAAAVFAATVLTATLLWPPRPLLIWNASVSAPVGLYAVLPPRELRVGHMVIAWTPEPARTLAAKRRYLPSNVPLVKRVAAVAGSRVCAIGESVWIDGRHMAFRRQADGAGRSLPQWCDCHVLGEGQYFLLMESGDSFDGRYFGVTPVDAVIGRAILLWAG